MTISFDILPLVRC